MRAFDWQRLLEEQRIEYVTRGPNVKRGEINIKCPFCGSADPSHHMGLNLENGWWSCWRRRDIHSGKSPLRLIMALLRVPYGRAREIAGLGDDYVDPEGFDAVAARILGKTGDIKPSATERRFLDFEPDFQPITDKVRTRRHWNYLFDRGFKRVNRDGVDDVDRLVRDYKLMAGMRGNWTDRIIIPFYLDGQLVTWTGRAIGPSERRYRDLELQPSPWRKDAPWSILGPKETLYNVDCISKGGKALVLQEGPFDVLKVDFYGRRFGVRSVGLATNSMSEAQTHLLRMAEGKFHKLIVMMDTKSDLGVVDSLRMRQNLAFIPDVRIEPVPYGAGDGGALTAAQVEAWAQQL